MIFHIEDDALTIKFQGLEMLWALRRRLVIPKTSVANVGWHASYRANQQMLRIGGTALPGALYAGVFRSGNGWRFMYLNRPHGLGTTRNGIVAEHVLVLDVQGMRYSQLLLTCPEPMAEEIKLWWSGRRRH